MVSDCPYGSDELIFCCCCHIVVACRPRCLVKRHFALVACFYKIAALLGEGALLYDGH